VTCHTSWEINCGGKKHSCAKNSETADHTDRISFLPWLLQRVPPLCCGVRQDRGTPEYSAPQDRMSAAGFSIRRALGRIRNTPHTLAGPPILALPRAEGLVTLDTDASQEQIGCCLFQEQDGGTRHPVGYLSRGLTSAERNYSTTEKGCLAIVWAVLQLRPYLEGKHFVIRTDYNSLRWVLNLADAQGRLAK
jgi:RNase H-like domain found in reverse transcriptase